MITQNWRDGNFISHFAKILGISIVPLLLLVSILCSPCNLSPAFAGEKQDVVKGTINLALEPGDNPNPNPNPQNPQNPQNQGNTDNPVNIGENTVSGSKVDSNVPADNNNNTVNKQNGFKGFLAKTGDYLPYVALAILLTGATGVGVVFLIRKKKNQLNAELEDSRSSCRSQKLLAFLLSLTLVGGSGFAVSKALAEDLSENNTNNIDMSIGTLLGRIAVNEDGVVKYVVVHIKNNLKTPLNVSTVSVDSDSDIAGLVDDQIIANETLVSGDFITRTIHPSGLKINNELLAKLKSGELNSPSYPINVAVSYKTVTVQFALNDGSDKAYDTQEIPEGGNAVLPSKYPDNPNRDFFGWYLSKNGTDDKIGYGYLASQAINKDTMFFAKWSGPKVFLAKKTYDKDLPCKIYSGEDKSTEIKTIEEVKAAATTLRNGGKVDEAVYSAKNDKWHLFVKISKDGNRVNDWLESRIIHTGQHDADGTGITFQATHALLEKLAYDSKLQDDKVAYTGNWSSSTLRSYLNGAFLTKLPESLKSSLSGVIKKSNLVAGEHPVTMKDAGLTDDKMWILSYTELVKNAGTKNTNWGANANSHDGSTYKFWEWYDFRTGEYPAKDTQQTLLLKDLNCNRAGVLIDAGSVSARVGVSWLRSLSAHKNNSPMYYLSDGFISKTEDQHVKDEYSVAPCFAF